MLWSLLKLLLFLAAVAGLTLGAGYLLEADGGIRISLGTMEYNLGAFQAILLIVVLLFGFWVLLKLVGFLVATLRFLNGDETAISRYFDRNREQRGYQALSESMIALASGEGREAMHRANRAQRLLQKPELTNLLAAQAAEMAGDTKRAEEVYKALLAEEPTRFVGVRGIMKQRLAEGDTGTALKLAEKAFALKPRHVETQDILLKLQAGEEDWTGARKTLAAKYSSGALPRDVHRRRDAVLALSEAIQDGDGADAIEANRLSPGLVPAAVMAARAHIDEDKPRYAARVIKKAWETTPHPDLAAAFADIDPNETPETRLKRFRPLVRLRTGHPETKMLLAELNIAAEKYPAARAAMGDLATEQPTARALTVMAAIERGEGSDDAVVRGWLTKALSAPRGPQWICDNCHAISPAWAPVCGNCEALDTMTWRAPGEGEVAMPASTEMLPLIVGQPEVEEAEEVVASPDAAVDENTSVEPELVTVEGEIVKEGDGAKAAS